MDKEQKTELIFVILGGLGVFWRSYKRSIRRRYETPETALWNIFGFGGYEVNDVDAAKELAKDITEIRQSFKKKPVIELVEKNKEKDS